MIEIIYNLRVCTLDFIYEFEEGLGIIEKIVWQCKCLKELGLADEDNLF